MIVRCTYDKLVNVSELQPHPKNRNSHPEAQLKRLAQVLEYQGWRYPVKVSKASGYVTSGHGRIEAAKLNGWAEVPVNYQEYESQEQEYADLVADNSIASWSELDLKGIGEDVVDFGPDFDLDLLGIEDFELEPADKYKGDDDATPEVPIEPMSKLGDVYLLGEHRLVCGDSTSQDAVALLMDGAKADMVFTDPPYGMDLDTDYSKIKGSKNAKIQGGGKTYAPVLGDGNDYDPSPVLGIDCDEVFMWGADYYHSRLPGSGSWLVWDKRGSEDADKIIGASFELCWSKQKHKKEIARIKWMGAFGIAEARERVHPTQKPAVLAEWFFNKWGKDKTNIIDLYGGSGSTLIACEKTNRKCYMMELEPKYIDVIITRWCKYVGHNKITRNGEEMSWPKWADPKNQ